MLLVIKVDVGSNPSDIGLDRAFAIASNKPILGARYWLKFDGLLTNLVLDLLTLRGIS